MKFLNFAIGMLLLTIGALSYQLDKVEDQIAEQQIVIDALLDQEDLSEQFEQYDFELTVLQHSLAEIHLNSDETYKLIKNLNWQLATLEERVVELQKFHSP